MSYTRKMLQDDELREKIASELSGRKWRMRIRTVSSSYVFLEHPEFPDHVFCSNSIIPSRPLCVGDWMDVVVEIAYDAARSNYGYVAASALRPQDNMAIHAHKTEFENWAAVMQKLLAKSETVDDEAAWRSLLPTGWNWSLEFARKQVAEIRRLMGRLTQCGSLIRLHGVPKHQTVEEIRDILAAHPREFGALGRLFENALEHMQDETR